jgi:mono/diheme cytochrome c family protein
MTALKVAPLLLALVLSASCSRTLAPKDPGGTGDGDPAQGQGRYAELCASCHGSAGQGATARALVPWTRSQTELTSIIETRMPQTAPGTCTGACARDIAAYLLSLGGEPVCDAVKPAPRQLRLLTRFEYANTVRDLLGGGATCSTDADCALDHESCSAGRCQSDGCGVHTFTWPAMGRTPGTVAVSGTFNAWAPTVAAGAWAMQHATQGDVWYVKHALAAGQHQYKFVIDGQWLADPTNPVHAPDGFGGDNSYLDAQCAPEADPLTAAFPPETRPKGYPFDNNAPAGLVSPVHLDAYLDAAHSLAATAAALPGFVPCAPSADCARQLVASFGKRAFRRPLASEEIDRYSAQLLAQATFAKGVSIVVETMLASPYFLYRSELGEPKPGGGYRLSQHEIASALSYTFLSSMPDVELLLAADRGELSTSDQVHAQAQRLLASPKARPTLERFALQWLGVERVRTGDVNATMFPNFSLALREAMAAETSAVFQRTVFDSTGKFDELLTADWTVVDPALAAFYGVTVSGEGPQRITLPTSRAGVLGQGSMLVSTSHSDQTSPILRGLFVRQTLLCQDLGTPPANAAKVPHVDATATTRERFSQHSSDPACSSCHSRIDPVGFGFEHFDAIGAWRDTDNGKPVDAAGDMVDIEHLGDGTHAPFNSLRELSGLLSMAQAPKRCFSTQVYRWTGGRADGSDDRCGIRALDDGFAAGGFSIQELLARAISSDAFLDRSEEVQP